MNTDFERKYIEARRAVVAEEFAALNPMQRQAVLATEGPLLILAGAGSGKTTVLINRIANLLKYGRAGDSDEVPAGADERQLEILLAGGEEARRMAALDPVAPWRILAITFTNKAAGELKERLERMLGPEANDIWACTFHSACVRILRRDAERLGFTGSFTIYDTADSLSLLKRILKDMDLDDKMFPPKAMLGEISRAKDSRIGAGDYLDSARKSGDIRRIRIGEIYSEYMRRMFTANAMDFDDLIFFTVKLLEEQEDVRSYWQRRFQYVLIDEYQDTNHLQYLLSSLLAGGWGNICVVGDDDQRIYKFRGATIENILSFEQQYKNCRTIRLEQNYRSTTHILDAANAVIRHNQDRKGKTLWTNNGAGELVTVKTTFHEGDEANFVLGQIMTYYRRGGSWGDCAVLYRTNAQSNALEYACKRSGVPYKIYGGLKFFDRAEVKDMLAYLSVINNPTDDLRLRRIINVPARKIGQTTVDKAQLIATEQNLTLYDVFRQADRFPALKSASVRLMAFTDMIEELRRTLPQTDLLEFYDRVCDRSGYTAALREKDDLESRGRLENVEELKSSILAYLENVEGEPSLSGFLDEIALYTDLDSRVDGDNCVTMMTMHAAKGLEFPQVFVVGM